MTTKNDQKVNKKLKLGKTGVTLLCTLPIATAATLGIILDVKSCTSGRTIVITDESGEQLKNINVSQRTTSEGLEITLIPKDAAMKVGEIKSLQIGDQVLTIGTDFTFDNQTGKLVIKKSVIEDNQAEIKITPILIEKSVSKVTISDIPSTVKVGDKIKVSASVEYNSNVSIRWYATGTGTFIWPKQSTSPGEEIELEAQTAGTVTIKVSANTASDQKTITIIDEEVKISNFKFGSTLKSAFTDAQCLTQTISPSSPKIDFTISTSSLTKDLEGHFIVYKTSGTNLGETTKETIAHSQPSLTKTIKVTTWTGLTSSDTLTIDWVNETSVKSIEIKGDHNAIIGNTQSLTYQVLDQDQNDVTSSCTFTTSDSTIGTFATGSATLTLTDKGKEQGGPLTITATYNQSNGNAISRQFGIELGSFDKLNVDRLLVNYVEQKDTSVSGHICIPSRIYDSTDAPHSIQNISTDALNADGITSIHISKNIIKIQVQAFGKGLSKLTVDGNNSIYAAPTDSNCIVEKLSPTVVQYGCINSDLTKVENVSKIDDSAFTNTGIASLVVPETVTNIGSQAFYQCKSLNSITFTGTPALQTLGMNVFTGCSSLTSVDLSSCTSLLSIDSGCFPNAITSVKLPTNNKWIQIYDSNKRQLNVSSDSTNATNFKDATSGSATGYNWGQTGIQTDSTAVKSAKVSYDTSSFSSAGVSVSPYNKEIFNADGKNKIYFYYSTTNMYPSAGTIAITNSSSQSVDNVKAVFKQYATMAFFTIEISDWTNISAQDTLTLTYTPSTEKVAALTYITTSQDVTFNTTSSTIAIAKGIQDTVRVYATSKTGEDVKGSIIISTQTGGTEVKKVSDLTFTTTESYVDITLTDTEWNLISDKSTLNVTFEKDKTVTKTVSFEQGETSGIVFDVPSQITLPNDSVTIGGIDLPSSESDPIRGHFEIEATITGCKYTVIGYDFDVTYGSTNPVTVSISTITNILANDPATSATAKINFVLSSEGKTVNVSYTGATDFEIAGDQTELTWPEALTFVATYNGSEESVEGTIAVKDGSKIVGKYEDAFYKYSAVDINELELNWSDITSGDTLTFEFISKKTAAIDYDSDDFILGGDYTVAAPNSLTFNIMYAKVGAKIGDSVKGTFLIKNGETTVGSYSGTFEYAEDVKAEDVALDWSQINDEDTLTFEFVETQEKTVTFSQTEWVEDVAKVTIPKTTYSLTSTSKSITVTFTSLDGTYEYFWVYLSLDDIELVEQIPNPGEGNSVDITFTLTDEQFESLASSATGDIVIDY